MRPVYLGPCWETFQKADGTVALTKLYAYRTHERRYALTEEDARAAVRAAGGDA